MSALAPSRVEQSQQALVRANGVRLQCAEWKRARAGREEAARVLVEEPGRVGALTIYASHAAPAGQF